MKRFPLLPSDNCPHYVPWSVAESCREQAERNHGGQTLETLAARGGLSPAELVCALAGKDWTDYTRPFADPHFTQGYIAGVIRSAELNRGA